MTIFSPLLQSLDHRSWTWGDLASGHLSGHKAFVALSKSEHKAALLKWIGSAANSYKLYNQAHTAGLFQRYPGLIRPIKYGAIALLTFNFFTYASKTVAGVMRAKYTHPEYYQGGVLWDFTLKANAIGSIAVAAFEYQTRPMKTVAFFTSGAVTLLDRTGWLSKDASALWKIVPWAARGNLFWTGTWSDRGFISLKTFYSLRK